MAWFCFDQVEDVSDSAWLYCTIQYATWWMLFEKEPRSLGDVDGTNGLAISRCFQFECLEVMKVMHMSLCRGSAASHNVSGSTSL